MFLVMARRTDTSPHGDRQTVWAVDEFVTLEEALEHYIGLIEDGWDRILVSQKIDVKLTIGVEALEKTVEMVVNNRSQGTTKKS